MCAIVSWNSIETAANNKRIFGEKFAFTRVVFFFVTVLHWRETVLEKESEMEKFSRKLFFICVSVCVWVCRRKKRINKVVFKRRNPVCLKVFIVKFLYCSRFKRYIFYCVVATNKKKKRERQNVIIFNVVEFFFFVCNQTCIILLQHLGPMHWEDAPIEMYIWQTIPNPYEIHLETD